jgi:uncharacterized membrane protein HdeD (DUF308 family)
MKPGIKTTEFWLSVIAIVGMFVPTLLGFLSPELAAVVSAIIVGAYSIARGIAKLTTTTIDDTILDAIEESIISKLEKK